MSVLQSFLTLCLLYMYEYWQPHLFKAPNIVSPQCTLLSICEALSLASVHLTPKRLDYL